MRKLLISIAIITPLVGCSSINIDKDSWDLFGDVIPRSLENLPFVYRPMIVQGNVVTQEMINKLKPGMSRKQVQFAMGTPMLKDVFHDDRWDYYYGIGIGNIELEKRVSIYFEDNQLVRITGDYQPHPPLQGEGKPEPAETVIIVPDWKKPKTTLIEKALETTGVSEKK